MSTVTALDYRRSDLRTNVLEQPFWITSALVSAVAAEDKAAMLFSFPKAGVVTIVHEICVQVVTVLSGGTPAGTIGQGSLATDAITTAGVVTDVDADDFLVTADMTWTTAGYYYPVTGCDFLTAKAAGSLSGPVVIVGAASTVPCICAYMNSGAIAAGTFRVHALISILPGLLA